MKAHIIDLLAQALHQLKQDKIIPADAEPAIQVDLTKDRSHGDFATNLAMMLSKAARKNPRDIARAIIDRLPESDRVARTEIAGPGFINLFLDPRWLAGQVEAIVADSRANIPLTDNPQTIVIDYSAPNVAKEMHVGHIRSTIIGDGVAKTLEFLGHKVIRANHIGDWGTQFGMLIAHLEDLQSENPDAADAGLRDLEGFYRESKKRYDESEAFAERARSCVVKLQSGDQACFNLWKKLVDVTLDQNQKNYDRLNVSLSKADTMGESLYNPMLKGIVDDLKEKGLAVEDDGACVVFLDEFKNKDGDPMGVIIQKRDGGFLYTTTDIACARYRYEKLHANRILYFIDSRQAQHLQQAWSIVRKAGYVPPEVTLEHHAFGMMLGKDGKPFKTRSGGTVKLVDLLDEAVERATRLVSAKNPDLAPDELDKIGQAVGIGAVKYADLSKNRTTDYIFDWDNMLAFEGNTAPYLQYAYTRIQSIFRKAELSPTDISGKVTLTAPAEESLGQKLIQFSDIIQRVADRGTPHLLCGYLYELAGTFMTFYEACPVNKQGVSEQDRASRLQLCAATAKTLKTGLQLLGIPTLDKM
ncbi:MAG: arginine--tRNA ligase [Gammaproteobacteria bacterium]|nr:MAG: arginine--tRNA ligase [Pseudomonadota bacterium]PIE38774.1 MAG: arginine--tRNA ligase [Gammaproteobacteria bacterium]